MTVKPCPLTSCCLHMDFNTSFRKLASTGKETAKALNPYKKANQNNTTDALPFRHRIFFVFVFCLFVFFNGVQFIGKPHRFLMCYTLILHFLFQYGKSRRQRWEYKQQLLNPLPLNVTYFYYTGQWEQQNTKSLTSLLKRWVIKKCIHTFITFCS